MQLASLTVKFEKKKSSRYVIPPSHFSHSESNDKLSGTSSLATDEKDKAKTTVPISTSEEIDVVMEASDKFKIPSENTTEAPSENSELKNTSEKIKTDIIPRPQILTERNAKKVSALSLKSIQKKHEMKRELVANKPDVKNLPYKDFTEDEMLAVWQSYSAIIEKEGKYNLHSHLSMGVPKLEGVIIHLEFPNNTIKLEVERSKYELLEYLKENLQNYSVSISIEVNEISAKRYAYTDREKFEKLKEINPLIEKLRIDFDLDV
jgi:DNA polymerase-3 subunit gamma/tau